MNRICEGRVVVVTGAGRGLGRAHALAFAAAGAKVVVNDLGVDLDGTPAAGRSAGEVAVCGSASETAANRPAGQTDADRSASETAADGSVGEVAVGRSAGRVALGGSASETAANGPAGQTAADRSASKAAADRPAGEVAVGRSASETAANRPVGQTAADRSASETAVGRSAGQMGSGGVAREVVADSSSREVGFDSPARDRGLVDPSWEAALVNPTRHEAVDSPAQYGAFDSPAARQAAVDNPAQQVVDEIRAAGGEAIAHCGDIATSAGAASLVAAALETYGRLDTLVNNAGFLRDRMLVNLDEDDWDAVVRVHLKGHFLLLKHAAAHWRAETKAGRTPVARVVNTSSGAGLLGSLGQANYSAAKAGIVALTLVAAAELARYGVQVNAIAPAARTRMTERTFAESMAAPDAGFDAMAPENVSPLVVWLGSAASEGVTGRVFEAEGGRITVMEGWRAGPTADKGARWTPEEAGETALKLLGEAGVPGAVYGA